MAPHKYLRVGPPGVYGKISHKRSIVDVYEMPVVSQRIEEETRCPLHTYLVIVPHQLDRPRSTWCSVTYHRTHWQAIEYMESMQVLGYFAWCKPC